MESRICCISMQNINLMELSIKKPCHENWSEMTPNAHGAFCGKCVKTVIDFSSRSLEEIKTFFSTRGEQKVCGRFEESQLTTLSFDTFFNRFKRFEFTKRFAVIVFFTFGTWLFGASTISAQSKAPLIGDVHITEPTPKDHRPVKRDPAKKDSVRCSKPMIMGKIAPVKPIPVEPLPIEPLLVEPLPVDPLPVKPLIAEPLKTGEVNAPAPKRSGTP